MASVDVRPAQAEDVTQLVALVREVLAEFGLEFGAGSETDAQLLELPASYERAGGRFWVAQAENRLVGTCGVYPLEPGVMELRKMYLARAARGGGLGRQLLAEAVSFARAARATRMVLDTVDQMERAIAFYEAHGFRRDDQYIRGARCTRGYVLAL
jgi:putative acetyltransferase